MKTTNYPYQDTITPTLPGELWIDILGFEESFQVSNLGRVKSLDRIVSHSRCGTQFVKGRILKYSIKKHYNNFRNEFVLIPQVTLMLNNKRHEYSVKRLVYFSFNNWKMTKEDSNMIVPVDNDGLNCRLVNLKAQSKSEKILKLIAENRTDFTKKRSTKENIKPTFNLWKPVSRCTVDGEVLETYPCIAHASKSFGCYEKGISKAIRNGTLYRGFNWKLAPRAFLEELRSKYPEIKRIRKRRP